MYETCFITCYQLPTCFNHFCQHHQGGILRVLRINCQRCVSGDTQRFKHYYIELFLMFHMADSCILCTLVNLHDEDCKSDGNIW